MYRRKKVDLNSAAIRKLVISMCAAVIVSLPVASANAQEVWDPIEPVNRGIFWFNDKFDRHILEPVSEGYVEVVPESVRKGIGNFLDNLESPINIVNSLLQLKFGHFIEQTGRFAINSTIGVAGIFDVATDMGLPLHEEDFGQTLGHYCIGPGPYIVLPFLGPSNLRDTIGRVADGFADPVFYVGQFDISDNEAFAIGSGIKVIDAIDTRARLKEAIDAARESSVDYYLFVQGAYLQHRRGLIYDGNPPDEDEFEEEDRAALESENVVEEPERSRIEFPGESMMLQ